MAGGLSWLHASGMVEEELQPDWIICTENHPYHQYHGKSLPSTQGTAVPLSKLGLSTLFDLRELRVRARLVCAGSTQLRSRPCKLRELFLVSLRCDPSKHAHPRAQQKYPHTRAAACTRMCVQA